MNAKSAEDFILVTSEMAAAGLIERCGWEISGDPGRVIATTICREMVRALRATREAS